MNRVFFLGTSALHCTRVVVIKWILYISLCLSIADPTHNNIFTSSVGLEATIGVIALSITPLLIEAKKTLSPGKDHFRAIPW